MAFAKINEIENKYQEDKAVIEAKEITEAYTQEMKDAELKELKDTRDADINAVITGYQDMQDNLNGNITPIDHNTMQTNTTKYIEEVKKISKPTPETLADDSKTALGELKRTIQHTQYEYLTIFSKYEALKKESNDAKTQYDKDYAKANSDFNTEKDKIDEEYGAIDEQINNDSSLTAEEKVKKAEENRSEWDDKIQEQQDILNDKLKTLNTNYTTLTARITADIAALAPAKETGFSGNLQVDQDLTVKGNFNLEGYIIDGDNEIDIKNLLTSNNIVSTTQETYEDTDIPSAAFMNTQISNVNDKLPSYVKLDTEATGSSLEVYSKGKVDALLQDATPTIDLVTSETDLSTISDTKTVATSLDYINSIDHLTSYHYVSWSDLFKAGADGKTPFDNIPNYSIIFVDWGYYSLTGTYILKLNADYCLCFQIPKNDSDYIYIRFVNSSSSWASNTSSSWRKIPVADATSGKINSSFYNAGTTGDFIPTSTLVKVEGEDEYNVPTKNYVSDMITSKVDKTHITTYYRTATHSYRYHDTNTYAYDTIGYIKPINRTFTLISGKIKVSVVGSMECCEMFEVSIVYKASGTATKDFNLIGTSLKSFPSIGKSAIILKQVDEDKSAYEVAIVIDDYSTVEGCGYRITAELPTDMMKLYSDSACTTEQSTSIINTLQSTDAFGKINKEDLTYNNIYWNEETRALKTEIPTFLKLDTETAGSDLSVYSKGKVDALITNINDQTKATIPLLNPFKDKWISVVTDDYYDCPPYTIGYNNNNTATSGLDVSQFWWYKLIHDLGAKKGPIYVDPTLKFNETITTSKLNDIFADGIRMKKGETYYDIDDARTQRTFDEDDRYADVVIFALGNNSYWYDTTRPTLAQWKSSFENFISLVDFQFTPIYLPLSSRYSETKHNFEYPENDYNEILYNNNHDVLKIPMGEILFNTTDIVDAKFGTNNIHLWDDCANYKMAHMIYTKMLTSGINLCAEDGTTSVPVNYQTVKLNKMIEDCVADSDVITSTTDTVDNPDKQVASITYVSGITNGMLTTANVQNEDVVATVAETGTTEETKIMVPSVAYMESKLTAIGESYDDLDDRLSSVEAFINKIEIVND